MESNQSNQVKSGSGVDVEMRTSHKTNFSLNHLVTATWLYLVYLVLQHGLNDWISCFEIVIKTKHGSQNLKYEKNDLT